MPISCPIEIVSLSAEEFEELDYRVMGYAFQKHFHHFHSPDNYSSD